MTDATFYHCSARRLVSAVPPGETFDLVFGSPPYALKLDRYATLADRNCPDACPSDPDKWAAWMCDLTADLLARCTGFVIWVVDSPRACGSVYIPAVEMLTVALHRHPAICLRTPHVWHKNGPPGSPYYPGHDWEKVLVCDRRGFSKVNMAEIGHPAKYDSGPGRQRSDTGGRKTAKAGVKKGTPARPRDVVRVTVGGGHMGRVNPATGKVDLADDRLATGGSEAPFPWKLADWFVRGFSPPGGKVCDPFLGSGTTALASAMTGRDFVGCDVRDNQLRIARERLRLAGCEPTLVVPKESAEAS
jgi:hypothetical protein